MVRKHLRVALAVAALCVPTLPGWGQTAKDAAPVAAPRQPGSLQDVTGEIVWKPEQQGVLLIVAPGTIKPQTRRIVRPDSNFVDMQPIATLPPKSVQGLRVTTLERYFEFVPVPCGGVIVLAPVRMTILNFENLPQPSLYTNLKPGDSFQLLQGSLSKAQWQSAASVNGLGKGDLDAKQGELFLAAFAGMRIVKTQGNKSSFAPLQEGQRHGLRIRFVRRMNWTLKSENGRPVGIGDRGSDRTSLMSESLFQPDQDQNRVLGVELMRDVAAHSKPGQLPFDWEALDARIDLSDIKTVEDLVARVRKTTRVELYCDAHYASLPLFVRGEQARAGNLLKALARGVNGTWRRVGNTYVLTNDVVGLATRQARIYNWINQNLIKGAEMDRKLLAAVRAIDPAPLIQFADDGFKPSDTLLAQFREHEKSLYTPLKEGDPPPDRNKVWPIASLPEAVQKLVRSQLQELSNPNIRRFRLGGSDEPPSPVNAKAVELNFDTRALVNIPGVGWVESPYAPSLASSVEEQQKTALSALPVEARAFPPRFMVRACIIRLGDEDEFKRACTEAARAGFTDVWADVEGVPSAKVKAAVETTHAAKLKFRALVSAFRQRSNSGKASKDESTDRNLLGETYTQRIDRAFRDGVLPPVHFEEDALRERTTNVFLDVLQRQRERGDWRDPGAPDSAMLVARTVESLVRIAPIDGVVVQDIVPPGYGPTDRNMLYDSRDRIDEGGYTVARRVAFIRRFGTDPVDISPLRGSDFFAGLRYRFMNAPNLQVPEFSEYGRKANGQEFGNPAESWNRSRQDALQDTLKRVHTRLQAVAGDRPVWFYQKTATWKQEVFSPAYVESRDTLSETVEDDSGGKNGVSIPDTNVPTARARARSSTLLYTIDISLYGLEPWVSTPESYLKGMAHYLFGAQSKSLKDWDGIVFDLSSQPASDAAALLELLPASTPPQQSPKLQGAERNNSNKSSQSPAKFRPQRP